MRDGVHIRLTLTRGVKITTGMDPRLNQAGPTLIVLAEHKPPVYGSGGITLITAASAGPRPTAGPEDPPRNLIHSILAKIEANVAGADDALMLDPRGFVAETNATHVFLVDRRRGSHAATVACPEGITRATVLELCRDHAIPAAETDLSLTEVYRPTRSSAPARWASSRRCPRRRPHDRRRQPGADDGGSPACSGS